MARITRRRTAGRRTRRTRKAAGMSRLAKASLAYRTVGTTYVSAINKCWKKSLKTKGLVAKARAFRKLRQRAAAARASLKRYQASKGKHGKVFLAKKRKALARFAKLAIALRVKARTLLRLVRASCYKKAVVRLHKRSKKAVRKRRVTRRKKSTGRKLSSRRKSYKLVYRRRKSAASRPRRRTARRSYADWEALQSGGLDASPVDWKRVSKRRISRRRCIRRRRA